MLATLAAERRRPGAAPAAALPSLVLCPPTLVGHWASEVARYVAPPHSLAVLQYAGPPAARLRLAAAIPSADVVVASYDSARADADRLAAQPWGYVVLDEGHAVRNPKSATAAAVKRVGAAARHRLLLSGTPIQNDVSELWALFDFLMPGFLGSAPQFRRRYGGGGSRAAGSLDALALGALHAAVRPFVLRRMKQDVLKELPPKARFFVCRFVSSLGAPSSVFLNRPFGTLSPYTPRLAHSLPRPHPAADRRVR